MITDPSSSNPNRHPLDLVASFTFTQKGHKQKKTSAVGVGYGTDSIWEAHSKNKVKKKKQGEVCDAATERKQTGPRETLGRRTETR